MERPEGNRGLSKESLHQSANNIVIGIAESPAGRRYIGMTFNESPWALLTTKRAPLAYSLTRELKEQFGIDAMPGMPINWRQSLDENMITVEETEGSVGVYVTLEHIDKLVDRMSGL